MKLSNTEYLNYRKIALTSRNSKMFLGEGRFGCVFKYDDVTAIKIIKSAINNCSQNDKNRITELTKNMTDKKIISPNLILPKELIFVDDQNIGYLMDFVSGHTMIDLFNLDKKKYYENLSSYLKKINKIMKEQIIENGIFYSDFKMGNIMVNEDIFFLDFDDAVMNVNQNILITEYNRSIINGFINCFYKSDIEYNDLKAIHYEVISDSKIDRNIKKALADPFRLDKHWEEHYITDELEQVSDFINQYSKKMQKKRI